MSPSASSRARFRLSLVVIGCAISVASCGASHEAEGETAATERDADVEALDASAEAPVDPAVDAASTPITQADADPAAQVADAAAQADAPGPAPAETRRHKCALVLRECNTGYYSSPSCPELEPLPGASCSDAQLRERITCYYCEPGQLTPKYYSAPYTTWSCSSSGAFQASQTACIVG